MSEFHDSQEVERRGMAELRPWFTYLAANGQFVVVGRKHQSDLCEILQQTHGDVLLNPWANNEHLWRFEVKVDQTCYKSFFLETESNRSATRPTKGWMYTSKAEWLAYYFIFSQKVYQIDFARLREWAFTKEKIWRFREVSKQNTGANLTIGRSVPIDVLRDEIGFECYKRTGDGLFVNETGWDTLAS